MFFQCTIFNLCLFIVCKIASEEKIKYSEDLAPVSIEELSFKAGLQKESLHLQTEETSLKRLILKTSRPSIQQTKNVHFKFIS